MKYNFLSELDLSDEVVLKISSLLSRIVKGSSSVVVSPLGKDLDPIAILSGWDKIFNLNTLRLSNDLFSLENLNRSKFGPRSLAADWYSRKDSVLDYFSSDSLQILPDLMGTLPRCLRPIDLKTALGFLKNDTNSGLPFYRKKGEVKDMLISEFTSQLARRDDCVMFTRTQEDYKTRTVWGYPMADTLNEMRYYRPLLQYQRKLNWRSALRGPNDIDLSLTKLINEARRLDQKLLSVDFSSYDASVKTGLQRVAFRYIKNLFQSDSSYDLSYIEERFKTIGLITPDGILRGNHGVPSGSTFTNEVDSIVQFICANSSGIDSDQCDIQGDDGVYRTSDPNSLKKLFNEFGLSVNDEKSYISNHCLVYLQCLYSSDYQCGDGIIRGIYPTYRALSRILFPERFDSFSDDGIEGADYYAIKTISILENCRNHPLFLELIKYVVKLDKFNLHYTQYGLQKYIQRIKKSSGAEGIIFNKPESLVHGLNSFKTVQILSKL